MVSVTDTGVHIRTSVGALQGHSLSSEAVFNGLIHSTYIDNKSVSNPCESITRVSSG